MAPEAKSDPPETFSDLPPESFWVRPDDEQDWFDRNAVMQRKTSLKLGFNRDFNSFSHRSDVPSNSKLARTSVFGLPSTQKSCGVDGKKPRRSLFRSRSEPGGKPIVQIHEPGSPRVSCTGRVGIKSGDGKKTGFSRLLSSLFGAGSGKNRSRKR
ncbi:Calcium/calmodulin-dependent protein kinase [Handroanthus impetiginosus]|uniref:Calcium/calmodulin-dependent protein kinase n=1 Tax=Handroanthus impetiginosus TaxID=429701 RepID=A0A2G9HBI0_9LAMI|nr:Calcium/calmodulin-dependent protein kinase [Handroanthus impetiginosus]